jgi:hypothetical protein
MSWLIPYDESVSYTDPDLILKDTSLSSLVVEMVHVGKTRRGFLEGVQGYFVHIIQGK